MSASENSGTSMRIAFDTNGEEFSRALTGYIRAARRGTSEAIREEAWQLARFLTVPPARVQPATPPGSKEQGEKAVARDIQRAISPLSNRSVSRLFTRNLKLAKKVRRYIASGNVQGLKAIFANTYRGPTFVRPSGFRAAHEAARDSRGRVRAKIPPHVTTDTAALRDYIKRRQRAVGAARGGWSPYILNRERVTYRVPDWIGEHVHLGSFVDRSNSVAPSVTLTNRSPWAGYRSEAERVMANAIKFRTRALYAKTQRALEAAGKGFRR